MDGATILVVEDEPHILQMVQYYLEGEGFSVNTAADGSAAVEALDGDAPDLVVLDIMLPHVSGIELLEQIRTLDGWNGVPVLMLTAKTAEEDVVRAFDLGADDYLRKPFQLAELVARINRLLRGSARDRSG